MTDPQLSFAVETVELDLPAVAGALSCRLHDAGMPATPGRSIDFTRALTLVRPVARRRLYWTARAVFVSDQAQVPVFDAVFASVFGGTAPAPDADPEAAPPSTSSDDGPRPEGRAAKEAAGSGARSPAPGSATGDGEEAELELPVARASDEERLRRTSFDRLEPHELAQLYELMSQLRLATPVRRSRRYERRRRGERIDLRRTLRAGLRTAGDPVSLARRRRRIVRRRLVLLCDISGSMEPYARAYLQFLTSAAGSGAGVEAFVFATRLTRITRALASRNPERALHRAAATAPDWSSGTRIGDALRTFNDRHGRRGMARGAVVVILSDGWERGEPILVAREMERLSRLAHRIVWVNPRVGATGFSVRSGGMVAALPYCDALVSGHSFEALGEVVEAIGADSWESPPAGAPPAEDETWASATPDAGSSVAMPSGHGPSRGRTTEGWAAE
ncbi:MAG TPA: VWA domain-containing protein [Gaiellaceae bacterium]|nr:VWA domain-containing protein [Gaiellaceae bacterium]